MTEEETQAAAYLKLHEDVKTLILTTVITELRERPYDAFASIIGSYVSQYVVPNALRGEMKNYRVVVKGDTASF